MGDTSESLLPYFTSTALSMARFCVQEMNEIMRAKAAQRILVAVVPVWPYLDGIQLVKEQLHSLCSHIIGLVCQRHTPEVPDRKRVLLGRKYERHCRSEC